MCTFEGGTLLLRETVTMLRSRGVILRGTKFFRYMVHVPVLVIIPVLKKKFLTSLLVYIYIYIYMCVCVCVCVCVCLSLVNEM